MGRPLGRLKRREDFLAVAAARTKRVTPGFVLQACHRDSAQPDIRVGFTASRKVGNAVVRNRAKRRLRALADRVIPELGINGMDYVLIGRRETALLPFENMEQDLRQAMKSLVQPKNTKGEKQ